MMYGRYGQDQLNLFLLGLSLLVWVAGAFVKVPLAARILSAAGYVFLILVFYRMFSRNYPRRRSENDRFLAITNPVISRFRRMHAKTRDRDHRYFRCPGCGQLLRVPRGKGRISIYCRCCGSTFQKKM